MQYAKAQVWRGGDQFELVELEIPKLKKDDVLVRIEAATVCGSDRTTVSGRRPAACPSVLGHEGAGIVEASRREGLKPGDRVVFAVTDICGKCERCRAGLSAKCQSVRKVGHEPLDAGWDLSGTYASHIYIPAGVAVEKYPENLPAPIAATAGCAVATVMAVLEAAGRLHGKSVLVHGLGMLGLTAVVAARAQGARVTATDPLPAARQRAQHMAHSVREEPDEEKFDVTIELAGTLTGAQTCVDALDIGGTCVLAGTVSPVGELEVSPEWIVRGWRSVTGVHNYEERHLKQAVTFLTQHRDELPWNELLGQSYPLPDLAQAFEQSPPGVRAIIVP